LLASSLQPVVNGGIHLHQLAEALPTRSPAAVRVAAASAFPESLRDQPAAQRLGTDNQPLFFQLLAGEGGAEVGVVYCTVVLTTGPLWGRRAWGIWWTWDARLTTTLVLWLIYVSYLLLRRFAAGPQVQTLAAVLGIFGALDVPIVYMSNRWWRTQHPAPVFGGDSDSGMKDPQMLAAFGWGMVSWLAWGLLILYFRYRVERKHQLNAHQEAMEALQAQI